MVDTSGTTAWAYDSRGRVTGAVQTHHAEEETFYTTNWEYNSADLPKDNDLPKRRDSDLRLQRA